MLSLTRSLCPALDIILTRLLCPEHGVRKAVDILLYIEFIDSTGLNYVMFAHNSVVFRN